MTGMSFASPFSFVSGFPVVAYTLPIGGKYFILGIFGSRGLYTTTKFSTTEAGPFADGFKLGSISVQSEFTMSSGNPKDMV